MHFLKLVNVLFLEKYGKSLWKMRPSCLVCRYTCCLLYYKLAIVETVSSITGKSSHLLQTDTLI